MGAYQLLDAEFGLRTFGTCLNHGIIIVHVQCLNLIQVKHYISKLREIYKVEG